MANNPAIVEGGPSLNPAGRPKDTPEKKAQRLKRSKLRRTEAQLRELNPQALENIRKSVNGETIDKEVVSTSKWVVTTTVAVAKAALAEEMELNGSLKVREANESEVMDADEEETSPMAEFSLDMLPTAANLRAVK